MILDLLFAWSLVCGFGGRDEFGSKFLSILCSLPGKSRGPLGISCSKMNQMIHPGVEAVDQMNVAHRSSTFFEGPRVVICKCKLYCFSM